MVTVSKPVRQYSDLDFSFKRHPISGDVLKKKNEESIRQSIRNLVLTRRGERPFHPEIGSPVYDYLFENASVIDSVIIKEELIKLIQTFEPRVRIDSIEVNLQPQTNSLSVLIRVLILNTTEPIDVNILVDRLR